MITKYLNSREKPNTSSPYPEQKYCRQSQNGRNETKIYQTASKPRVLTSAKPRVANPIAKAKGQSNYCREIWIFSLLCFKLSLYSVNLPWLFYSKAPKIKQIKPCLFVSSASTICPGKDAQGVYLSSQVCFCVTSNKTGHMFLIEKFSSSA